MGFKKSRKEKRVLVLSRDDLDDNSLAIKVTNLLSVKELVSPYIGRGELGIIELESDEKALVRTYYRGGFPGLITKNLYFAWPARPFRELVITEKIRLKGFPTLEVIAAVVQRKWGPFYKGWLVTRVLTGTQNLWETLQDGREMTSKQNLILSVAKIVRLMHRLGIYHSDLNLKNILIRKELDAWIVYVIDFDKSRLFSQELSRKLSNNNLNRLLRSVRKLDPSRKFFSHRDWTHFIEFYHQDS